MARVIVSKYCDHLPTLPAGQIYGIGMGLVVAQSMAHGSA